MYTLFKDFDGVVRDSDSAFIPADPHNTDYAAFLLWKAAGNTPTPIAPDPVVVPDTVTRLQGRLALFNAGLLDKVEAAVAAQGGAVAIWYADAQHFVRTDPIFVQVAEALSLTSAQVDALFVAAAQI